MVALHVGAWIETSPLRVQSIHFVSRSTWARGLKPVQEIAHDGLACRAPRGRVD